jgi:hypothetical protein
MPRHVDRRPKAVSVEQIGELTAFVWVQDSIGDGESPLVEVVTQTAPIQSVHTRDEGVGRRSDRAHGGETTVAVSV